MSESKKETKKESRLKKWLDFSDWSKTTWIFVAAFCVLICFTLFLLYKWITEPDFLFRIVVMWFVMPVQKLGVWGWVLFVGFMTFQSLAVPIPSELVLLSAGLVWGFGWGFILCFIGSFITGTLAYGISKKGGRPIVEKFIGKENVELVDYYIEKYGAPVILILRAIPFFAFDPVSYVSGLLKISYKKYIAATMIGAIPRCIFYAWLGSELIGETNLSALSSNPGLAEEIISQGTGQFNLIFIILLVVLGLTFILYYFVMAPRMRKNRNAELEKAKKDEKSADQKEANSNSNISDNKNDKSDKKEPKE